MYHPGKYYDAWDRFDANRISTKLTIALFPKRCYLSGKLLWLKYAYKQTAMWTGPGDPAYEHRWYDKSEFILKQLRT